MNALEIHGLCKRWPGFALQGLELTLPAGCILGLVGENGAGKSTTIRLILDMLHADDGSVSIFGEDIRRRGPLAREEIGVVLDDVGYPEALNAREIGAVLARAYRNWDAGALAADLVMCLAIGLLGPALLLPFLFWLGSEKGRLAYYLVLGLTFAVCFALPDAVALRRAAPLALPLGLAALVGVVGLLFALSAAVSVALYARREL